MVNKMQDLPSCGVEPMEKEWMTAAEAAGYLRIKRKTLLLWVRQGKIPGYVLSGIERRVWRFRKEDLDTMLLG